MPDGVELTDACADTIQGWKRQELLSNLKFWLLEKVIGIAFFANGGRGSSLKRQKLIKTDAVAKTSTGQVMYLRLRAEVIC